MYVYIHTPLSHRRRNVRGKLRSFPRFASLRGIRRGLVRGKERTLGRNRRIHRLVQRVVHERVLRLVLGRVVRGEERVVGQVDREVVRRNVHLRQPHV